MANPTDEDVNDVARAMWNSNPERDETPRWDELDDEIDAELKHEICLMARHGIQVWEEIRARRGYK